MKRKSKRPSPRRRKRPGKPSPISDLPSPISPAPLSRNAGERMRKIHQLLAAAKYPNTVQLARQLEVDQKTILRDLDWMKTHENAPIAYDRARHGFYYTEPFEIFLGMA